MWGTPTAWSGNEYACQCAAAALVVGGSSTNRPNGKSTMFARVLPRAPGLMPGIPTNWVQLGRLSNQRGLVGSISSTLSQRPLSAAAGGLGAKTTPWKFRSASRVEADQNRSNPEGRAAAM